MSNRTRKCKICNRKKCGKKDRCKEIIEYFKDNEGYIAFKGTKFQRILDIHYRLRKLAREIKECNHALSISIKPL